MKAIACSVMDSELQVMQLQFQNLPNELYRRQRPGRRGYVMLLRWFLPV